MSAETDCIIQVFAKAPRPGQVKTRLIPALGATGAAQLQRRLVEFALDTVRLAGIRTIELWCAPDARDPALCQLAAAFGARVHAQGDGDLGARMGRALAHGLARAASVVLIGSDAPALTPTDLRCAAGLLAAARADTVFVPAEDGGYVLVGAQRELRVAPRRLFEGIPWGSTQVMTATHHRLSMLGVSWIELPPRWDVDRPEDLARLRADPRLARLVPAVEPED